MEIQSHLLDEAELLPYVNRGPKALFVVYSYGLPKTKWWLVLIDLQRDISAELSSIVPKVLTVAGTY